MYSPMIGEVRMMLQNMRKAKDAIRGDGFGRAGYLKSEFKKAIRRLESLQAMLEEGPLPEASTAEDANPNCSGHGIDNVTGCECRLIARNLCQRRPPHT
jgi:hypothetical protein